LLKILHNYIKLRKTVLYILS